MFNLFKRKLLGLIQIMLVALVFTGIMSQANTVQASPVTVTITEAEFWFSPSFTSKTGGEITVKDLSGSGLIFGINALGFDSMYDFPKIPIIGWLTPIVTSGVTFAPVDHFGIYGPNADIHLLSNGVGFQFSQIEYGGIYFMPQLISWDVTVDRVVSSVPEPSSIAMMCTGLLVLLTAKRRATTTQRKEF